MPRHQLTCLQVSQTSIAYRNDPEEALQDRGNNVRQVELRQNTPEEDNNTSPLWCYEEEVRAPG